MNLLLRTFRARPGQELDLVEALHRAATQMIQRQMTLSVLTCQRAHDPQHIIWIENRGREAARRPSALSASAQGLESWDAFLASASVALPLEFLDGAYRYPLPPCQVWSVELDASAGQRSQAPTLLVDLPRRTGADRHVVGFSLYRTLDTSPLMLGFLALTPGSTPDDVLAETAGHARGQEPVGVWHPLSVLWTAGRLSFDADAGPGVSATRYPRTAFWARSAAVEACRGRHAT
jgi:hypothetical protein